MILSILNHRITKFQALYRGYKTRKLLRLSFSYFESSCCVEIEKLMQIHSSSYSYSSPISGNPISINNFSLLDKYDNQYIFIQPNSKSLQFTSDIHALNSQHANPSKESLNVLLQEELWLQKAILKRIKVIFFILFSCLVLTH